MNGDVDALVYDIVPLEHIFKNSKTIYKHYKSNTNHKTECKNNIFHNLSPTNTTGQSNEY